MIHPFYAYLRFLFKSSNQYGVHSPFVYSFITKGLADKDAELEQKVATCRNHFYKSKEKIKVTDYGAGSKFNSNRERSVSTLVKTAGIGKRKGRRLYQTLRYFRVNQILEIGTSLGVATAYMSHACPNSNITTLEGCPETARLAQEQFDKFQLSNIRLIEGEFSKTLPLALEKAQYELIYFDGNHLKKPTLDYFYQCLNHKTESSIFIFDDIHWSEEMEEAWELIKCNDEVSLSIDTFYWGMIFFKKERVKQHFTIRI